MKQLRFMRKKEYVTLSLVSVLAILPRIDLGIIMISDEVTWIKNGLKFGISMRDLNFGETLISNDPGVLTMWLSAGVSLLVKIVTAAPLYLYRDTEYFWPFLFPGQSLFSLVSVISIPIFYLLLKRIFDQRIALLSSILIALDPFLIAHSRIIHVDALLFNFIFLSILLFLVYIKENKKWALYGSGAVAGLAVLTKTPALILILFVFLSFSFLKKNWKDYISWMIFFGVTVVLLWPAIWGLPYEAISIIFGYDRTPTAQMVNPDPYGLNPLFYLTPLTLFLSIIVLPLLLRKVFIAATKVKGLVGESPTFYAFCLFLFALGFFVMFTLASQKTERYLLPIYPIVDTLAAVGVFWIIPHLNKVRPFLSKIVLSVIGGFLIFQIFVLLNIHPYYLAYYNPILPKPTETKIGWGEGLEKAAIYLNSKDNAESLLVSSSSPEILRAFFEGTILSLQSRNNKQIDYVVLDRGMFGRDKKSSTTAILNEYYPEKTPEKTIVLNGLEYVWIYSKDKR